MPAEAHAAFKVFQLEDVIGEHGCKFFDHRDRRTPGGIEFQECLDGFGIWQGTAALLTGQDDHRLSLMDCLAVGTFGSLVEGFGAVSVRGEMNIARLPLCAPRGAAPFIATGIEAILDPRRAGFHTIFRAERFEFLLALRIIVCNGVQFFPILFRALVHVAIDLWIGDDAVEVQDAHVLIVNGVRADGFEHFIDIGTRDGQFVFCPVRHEIIPWGVDLIGMENPAGDPAG